MPLDMYRLPLELQSDIDFGPGCSNYNEMSGISGYFVAHCTEIISSLQLEDVNNFKNTYDDQSRVKYLYPFATKVPLHPCETGKDFEKAQSEKLRGNEKFSEKNMPAAITLYSAGMTVCPLDTGEGRILFSILIANRSAAYFSSKQFDRAMFDINYLLKVGFYPDYLLHKVWFRKAKCHDMVKGQEDDAIHAYKQTLEHIGSGNLTESAFVEKINHIEASINQAIIRKNTPTLLTPQVKDVDSIAVFEPNEKYPAVSKCVAFTEDYRLGRFAKAAADIEPGQIIAQEKPHCAVLSLENCKTNCLSCAQSCATPIVCEYCAYVVYCGWDCKERGEIFHRWECAFLATLYKSQCSLNCLMALRIITQKPMHYFSSKNFDDVYDLASKPIYESQDYDTVFNLCKHENVRKHEEYLHLTFMAIFLLRLLKTTDYFGEESYDEILSDDEKLIGGLMLHHLQLLQFNAHEIAELTYFPIESSSSSSCMETAANCFKTVTVGGGVYPTLALFNHSCEPSVIRYNKGEKMILRAIKPIRKGEVIYENYGPLYTTHEILDRQVQLSQRYWFTCFCQPCSESWPLYVNMDDQMLRFPCKKCKSPHWIHRDTQTPFFICDNFDCKEKNNILSNLIGLSSLEPVCNAAESFYKRKLYEKAIAKYGDALNIYYKFLLPPFPDIVKIQQRLRNSMVLLGNRCDCNYN